MGMIRDVTGLPNSARSRVTVRAAGLVAVALLTLAGCGSDAAATSTAAPAVGATVTGTTTAHTAEQVAAALRGAGVPLAVTRVYTADTDPNHLLGRPNGYTSKLAFTDSRIPAAEVDGFDADATERGGSVEVYPDAAGATARKEFIQAALKGAGGVLGREYDYLPGGVIVRVTGKLTPDQAGVYERAPAAAAG